MCRAGLPFKEKGGNIPRKPATYKGCEGGKNNINYRRTESGYTFSNMGGENYAVDAGARVAVQCADKNASLCRKKLLNARNSDYKRSV